MRWARWRGGTLDVLFDGYCPLCRRTVRLLLGLDLFERLSFVDLHALDLSRYGDEKRVTLDRAALDEAMHVVWNRRAYRGFDGFRKIAGSLPLLWLLAPLLYIPGIPMLGRAVYRRVARSRMSMHACAGGACAIGPADPPEPQAVEDRPVRSISLPQRLLGPVAIALMIALLFGCWCMRVEYYPFTSMQMFATYTGTGVVTYYRARQTDEHGQVGQAFLDRMGFGASRYRPVMQNGFSDARGRQNCIDMLVRCGEFWNKRAPAGRRVTRLEVQKRDWDFINDRHNPDYGRVVDRIIVDFDPITGAAHPR
jgi:predicted DCC family thiol-disulfide oxidoreductase YuxK